LLPGNEGRIGIRGNGLFRGYENNADANRESFVNNYFLPGDNGWLSADNYLTLTGRDKEFINVSGEKVPAVAIDDRLMLHPKIAEAAACPLPGGVYGEVVGAAIVLRDVNDPVTLDEVRAWVAERHNDHKYWPREIVLVDRLPAMPSGKLARMKVPGLFPKSEPGG